MNSDNIKQLQAILDSLSWHSNNFPMLAPTNLILMVCAATGARYGAVQLLAEVALCD